MIHTAVGAYTPASGSLLQRSRVVLRFAARFRERRAAQVAEGVTTAGVVVGLGKRHRVALPVLTAVAQVLDGNLSARQAVWEIMNLPQISET